MTPGECVIWDKGGEFCNQVSSFLCEQYGAEIRVIQGGRPQANGIAESMVKNMKRKLDWLLMDDEHKTYPPNWDCKYFYNALKVLRSDPACATGFAPSELLLGRPLVYPCEMEHMEVDFSGTDLTLSLVQKMKHIRDGYATLADKRIKKYQKKYKTAYDKKFKPGTPLKVGDKVQYKRHKSKRTLSKDLIETWVPSRGYYQIVLILKEKKQCVLSTTDGTILKKKQSLYNLRKFKGR